MGRRFTVDGSDEFEARIETDLRRICTAVLDRVGAKNLTALVLGGGYGRGEGGVYLVGDTEHVYNDYDFFVVTPFRSRRRRRDVMKALDDVKRMTEPQCGIHVDFGPPMPVETLPEYPYELMYMEAKYGHVVVHGPEDVFDALPDYDRTRVPLEEGARLLMNRGVGLFLAGRLLNDGKPRDSDAHEFIVRNIHKAMMAMGDVVLFVKGDYSTSYIARWDRFLVQCANLDDLPDLDRVKNWYRDALDFKLRPQHAVPGGRALTDWFEDVREGYERVFLWFERKRLGVADLDWKAYGALDRRLPSGGARQAGVNALRHFRTGAWRLCPPARWRLHPRDTILSVLPGLLFGGTCKDHETFLRLWENVG